MALCCADMPVAPCVKPKIVRAIWLAITDSTRDFLLLSSPSQKPPELHSAFALGVSRSHSPMKSSSVLGVKSSQTGESQISLNTDDFRSSTFKPTRNCMHSSAVVSGLLARKSGQCSAPYVAEAQRLIAKRAHALPSVPVMSALHAL